jgi:hypothetical protein
MKKLIITALLVIGFCANATACNECLSAKIISESNHNAFVKTTKGKTVSDRESLYLVIDPCNHSVLLQLKNKIYDLVIYQTEGNNTIIKASTLDDKQIIEFHINLKTNEVETYIDDLVYTSKITNKIIPERSVAFEE